MSLDPILWAMKDAPTADINEWGTLVCLAEKADEDGCNAFPSVPTIASYAKISERTVQRALAAMEERKLIALGDQRAAAYIPKGKQPQVYDLLVPYDWFRSIERTNTFRVRVGRPPLTPENRPPIAPAPPKKERADKGKPKPKAKPKTDDDRAPTSSNGVGRLVVTPPRGTSETEGRLVVTPVDNPAEGVTSSHPATSSPDRGDYKSEEGRLEVTQPSPVTRTTEPPRPSVGSTQQSPLGTDGEMDGQPAQIRTRQQQTNVVERTRGVELLLGLGYERPELLLTGKVLADQAAMVDGLLASQWPREMILTALLRPLPPSTRSVGAVISRRLQDLAVTPVPQPVAMPEPRSPEGGAGYWERYEDSKASGVWLPDAMASGEGLDTMVRRRTRFEECQECRDPVLDGHGSGLCPQCRGWVKCPLCSKFVPSGEACRECEVRPDEVEFESCPDHGDRFVKGTSCFLCGTGR